MPTNPPPLPWVLQRRRRVGYRIRALREDRGLSQEDLGELSGLDRKTINRLERALRSPNVDQLVVISKALDVPTGALFT